MLEAMLEITKVFTEEMRFTKEYGLYGVGDQGVELRFV